MPAETGWRMTTDRLRIRAPLSGARQFALNCAPVLCERLSFASGFAVCRVAATCEREMIFEAPPSDQPRLHLQYVEQGAGRFLSDSGDHRMTARSALLFRGDADGCSAWTVAADTPFHVVSIDMSEEWLAKWFGQSLPDDIKHALRGADAPAQATQLPQGQAALMRLALVLHRSQHHLPLRALAAEGAAMQAIAECLDTMRSDPHDFAASGEKKKLGFVYERLLEPWDQPPALATLAAQAGMSPRRLQRAFRDHFGISLFRMLLDIRLTRSRDMLADGRMSIKEVAWHAGYTHPANFTHAFRERFGVPPSDFLSRGAESA